MKKLIVNRKNLDKVVEMFIETETKQLVVMCKSGNGYIGDGIFNDSCHAITDYHFQKIDVITDRPQNTLA